MRKLITLLTIGLALTSCQKDHYLADLNAAEAEVAQLENQVRSLESQITSLQADAITDQAVINTLRGDLTEAQNAIQAITNANAAQRAEMDAQQATINDLNAQLDALNSRLTDLQAELITAQNNDADEATIASLQTDVSRLEAELATAQANVRTIVRTVVEYVDRIVYVTQTETPDPRPQMGNEEGVNNSYISVGTQAFYTSPDSPILLPQGQRFLFVTISVLGDTLAYVDSDTQPSNGAIPFAAGTYTIAFYDGDFSKAITFTIQ